MAAKGCLRPLDPLVSSGLLSLTDFHPSIQKTADWQGTTFGIPVYCTIGILAARRDLFEERSLTFPKTFDEVIENGRRFHQPDQGRYGIVFDGARGMPIASTFLFFLGACGSPPLARARAGTRGGMTELISSEAGRTALGYMCCLLEIAPPDALNLAWDQNLALFLSGRASMAYCWTMRASRMEYDIQSVVKRRVEYLFQPAGPGGGRASPIGGFLLANLPPERVELAAEAIAWMTSEKAMHAHVRNGFPVAPRFSTSADPEASAGSPIVRFVDGLARRQLLTTWQRPNIPAYTRIEAVIGREIHAALRGATPDDKALGRAGAAV